MVHPWLAQQLRYAFPQFCNNVRMASHRHIQHVLDLCCSHCFNKLAAVCLRSKHTYLQRQCVFEAGCIFIMSVHDTCFPTTTLVHCTHQLLRNLHEQMVFQNRRIANSTVRIYAQGGAFMYIRPMGNCRLAHDCLYPFSRQSCSALPSHESSHVQQQMFRQTSVPFCAHPIPMGMCMSIAQEYHHHGPVD